MAGKNEGFKNYLKFKLMDKDIGLVSVAMGYINWATGCEVSSFKDNGDHCILTVEFDRSSVEICCKYEDGLKFYFPNEED